MTMDFSRLHTYTPPQCAPENTGYTYSLSSSYSTAALEFEKEHQIAPVFDSPRMSRRSLRLQAAPSLHGSDGLADASHNHNSSVSYTSSRRETRTVRSRRQQSAVSASSLSESLSQISTPRQTLTFSATSTPAVSTSHTQHSSFSSRAAEASLALSALEQDRLRKRTITTADGARGSGHHAELRGTGSRFEHHSSSGVNGDASTSKSHANGYICHDCSIHSHRTDALTARSSASLACSEGEACAGMLSTTSSSSAAASSSSAAATSRGVISRDAVRTTRTGVLVSVSNTLLRCGKLALAPFVSLVALFLSSASWLASKARNPPGKGVLVSFSDCVRRTFSSSVSSLWLFQKSALHRLTGYGTNDYEAEAAHSSYCGSINVRGLVTEDSSQLNLNGSLCDDCKGKQHSESHTVLLAQSSRPARLAGALWSLLAYTGSCLLQPGHYVMRAGRALGSGAGTAVQRLVSLLWMLIAAPVKAGRGLVWFLATGWYQLVSLMSLLNVFFLTRVLPKLWRILLFLLPFLLLLALWLWGPSCAALLAYLPAVNLTEWTSVSPLALLPTLVPAPALAPVPAPAPVTEAPIEPTAATPAPHVQPALPPVVVSGLDAERLERLEKRLGLLWERVQQGEQTLEGQHSHTLGLLAVLKEQLNSQPDRESLSVWVSSLLEQRLGALRGELERERTQRAETEGARKEQQQSQATRLAEVEVLLNLLASKTEEMQHKQHFLELKKEAEEKEKEAALPSPPPAPISVGVAQEDHDALLAEVQRLEAELSRIRQDLLGVMGCKGKCEQLDTLQETISSEVTAQVSSQVRSELRALFFGRGQAGEAQGEVPEDLLLWLSKRYVSGVDLQASLAALEMSILRNVSLQLVQSQKQTLAEVQAQASTTSHMVTQSVQYAAAGEGLSEEQVQLIVQNALKLYSQDRTGMVDYALESGGGSILSTRCSETYETKTALMSLFGLPLWYFSQSPRVVIQPDVYPGNCWAFKGSQGYLVIRLSLRVLPTSFCLEHIPKALSPTGNITSAPRNFTVFGLDDEYQEEGTLLGHYTYQEDGESLQTFPVTEKNDKAFQIIEVRVLTNWGHPEYTCLYRFRVHGEPRPH